LADEDAGYTRLDLQRSRLSFPEVNKKNLILICRLGSFDLEVTGGRRNIGPRVVSFGPSLAVITPTKSFSVPTSPSPAHPIDSMCQLMEKEKKGSH
jgi:hypothetical protein